jgi:predicted DNA-binding transcriptional regulator AlpA
MKSVPTGATSPEPDDFPRRRATPSLDALPAEAIKGRILNSAQAAEYWGVSLPHWRRLCRAGKAPHPIRIGERKNGWRLGVLDDALTERAEGTAK